VVGWDTIRGDWFEKGIVALDMSINFHHRYLEDSTTHMAHSKYTVNRQLALPPVLPILFHSIFSSAFPPFSCAIKILSISPT